MEEAIVLNAEAKKGIIQATIPSKYLSLLPEKLKIIIVFEENVEKPLKKKRKKFSSAGIDTKNIKFNREELYERD